MVRFELPESHRSTSTILLRRRPPTPASAKLTFRYSPCYGSDDNFEAGSCCSFDSSKQYFNKRPINPALPCSNSSNGEAKKQVSLLTLALAPDRESDYASDSSDDDRFDDSDGDYIPLAQQVLIIGPDSILVTHLPLSDKDKSRKEGDHDRVRTEETDSCELFSSSNSNNNQTSLSTTDTTPSSSSSITSSQHQPLKRRRQRSSPPPFPPPRAAGPNPSPPIPIPQTSSREREGHRTHHHYHHHHHHHHQQREQLEQRYEEPIPLRESWLNERLQISRAGPLFLSGFRAAARCAVDERLGNIQWQGSVGDDVVDFGNKGRSWVCRGCARPNSGFYFLCWGCRVHSRSSCCDSEEGRR
ncbi:hypothetical protein C7999DRAFT_32594 [Corynascus novoguineensis]|uniref:Uncharacterized protein n=1 Tax=Corynascus novoguineensis TaxID=1126955 RepID=A0AAN7CRK0_9PEZI|nr:hypothetical protein C7999DRAFT_32594 [Corynascus novoguineensis]